MIDESEPQSYGEMRRFDDRSLRVISVLGRGAKGVVFLARDEEGDEWLALKIISRDLIERKGKSPSGDGAEYRRVCFERDVLRRFQHPLLPRLRGVYETESVVGYAIDYCPGRNLNSLRKKQTEKMFSDDVIRFYAAELVMALEYVHSLGIVYRDLKPENIMIQDTGHIMLVDFDLSTSLSPKTPRPSPRPKVFSTPQSVKKKRFLSFSRFFNSGISPERSETPPPPPPRQCKLSDDSTGNKSDSTDKSNSTEKSNSTDKSNSFVGTEEYVAPEIVSGHGHDFAVDWWSMGVVLYEMLYGTTPFRGSNRRETFFRILTKPPELTGEATPLRDLIRKLLDKDPTDRIDLLEIKGHDFFSGVDWDSVYQISRPPFIPEDEISSFDDVNKKVDVEVIVQEIFGHKEGGEEAGYNNEKQHDRPFVPADPHPNSHNHNHGHGEQQETQAFYEY